MSTTHAIVLAGGRARRLGGVDKMLSWVGGRPLLAGVVAALADLDRVAVVGPQRDLTLDRPVLWAREDPPFGGPAAAVAAGLAALDPAPDDSVLVLAGDLVRPDLVVEALRSEDGNRVGIDPSGHRQWACSRVRAGDLAAAVHSVDTTDSPLRAVIGAVAPVDLLLRAEACADVDTPDDLQEYGDDEH